MIPQILFVNTIAQKLAWSLLLAHRERYPWDLELIRFSVLSDTRIDHQVALLALLLSFCTYVRYLRFYALAVACRQSFPVIWCYKRGWNSMIDSWVCSRPGRWMSMPASQKEIAELLMNTVPSDSLQYGAHTHTGSFFLRQHCMWHIYDWSPQRLNPNVWISSHFLTCGPCRHVPRKSVGGLYLCTFSTFCIEHIKGDKNKWNIT